MRKYEWQIQAATDGVQFPTFVFPECLGIGPDSFDSVKSNLVKMFGADVGGTAMNSEYTCFDIRTGKDLSSSFRVSDQKRA